MEELSIEHPSVAISEAKTFEEEVIKTTRIHKSFRLPSAAPGIKITDLPNLESVTEYGVSEEIEETLWVIEATRLVKAVTSDAPLEFTGSQNFTSDTSSSYDILASLADQVWLALNIDIHDADSSLVNHAKSLVSELEKARMILEHYCDEENDAAQKEEMTPENRRDFFNLVDYCTAVIARVVCASAEGKSLHVNILAYLARVSTKLKVLSTNLRHFAQISLDNAPTGHKFNHRGYTGLRGRPGGNDEGPDFEILRGLRTMDFGEFKTSESHSREDAVRKMYYMQCAKYRAGIHILLRIIIVSLRGTSHLSKSPLSSYEICAIVYGTGFEGLPTLVYQNRDSDLMGTSDAPIVNFARSGFDVLNQAVKHVQGQIERSSAGPSLGSGSSAQESIGTRVFWSYPPDGPSGEQGPMFLKSMSHIVTVIVPLLVTSPMAARGIEAFINIAIYAELSEERLVNPIQPRSYGKYEAFFSLTTEAYHHTQEIRGPEDAKSLSSALMRCQNLFSGPKIGRFGTNLPGAKASISADGIHGAVQSVRDRHMELEIIVKQMDGWVFQEKGVRVQCRKYIFTWMCICTLLVLGGIAVGATIGERITGVDPFNITAYSWVLAAFLLLVSKSIRVEKWTWNDYLHGRVFCKSVLELSRVTGIDEQFILAKLLQDEKHSFLQTRGPYNTVFERKSGDGFSIDAPLGMWAMLLSGLIMVETESIRGRSLVCLDLRRGTEMAIVSKLGERSSEKDERYIHCLRLLGETGETGDDVTKRIRLTRGRTLWLRAVGLYANRDAKYI
ncbi:hypothetical protein F4678DRAFT_474217 [Xylaria arbuscula]|nr:hypothetical protein F4678DRAFT_474217 [Xylaria arbuscula]